MKNQDFFDHIIAGRNSVMEALRAGRSIDKIFVAKGMREGSILKIIAIAREKGIPVVDTDANKIAEQSGRVNHQGVMAAASAKEYVSVEDMLAAAETAGEKPLIIICDGISDEMNLGAIIRSAEAFGAHGVIIPKRNSAAISPVVAKTASGAVEYVNIAKVTNIAMTIEDLKKKNIWIAGTDASATQRIDQADFNIPLALVVGSEGAGISRLVKEKCDFLVAVPMQGQLSSLNASAAAAVFMYEAVRQRLG